MLTNGYHYLEHVKRQQGGHLSYLYLQMCLVRGYELLLFVALTNLVPDSSYGLFLKGYAITKPPSRSLDLIPSYCHGLEYVCPTVLQYSYAVYVLIIEEYRLHVPFQYSASLSCLECITILKSRQEMSEP